MISFESKGSFSKTEAFLNRMKDGQIFKSLDQYGQEGVRALESATPVDTSETAHSWYYEIGNKGGEYFISWSNRVMAGSVPLVIILQYGHATGTGGYVQGRDFINPAIQPVFDRMANDLWKAVTK